eukprot:3813440-Rhodomonas_salina.1
MVPFSTLKTSFPSPSSYIAAREREELAVKGGRMMLGGTHILYVMLVCELFFFPHSCARESHEDCAQEQEDVVVQVVPVVFSVPPGFRVSVVEEQCEAARQREAQGRHSPARGPLCLKAHEAEAARYGEPQEHVAGDGRHCHLRGGGCAGEQRR